MKKIYRLLFIALLAQSAVASASALEAGKEKFKSTCVACHGVNAERKALGISQVIAKIGDAKIIAGLITKIRDKGAASGKNMAMVNAVSSLKDKEIINLSIYIASLKK